VLWSNPGDGSGVSWIVPAVPSATGVADVFAFQNDGTVQAITSDGTTAWTAQADWAIPDFQGGLIVEQGDSSIWKLDGITGQPYPVYTPTAAAGVWAVHPDGTIFAIQQNNAGTASEYDSVLGIDPTTGLKFSVPLESNDPEVNPPEISHGATWYALDLIVAGDGYAYVPYAYSQLADAVDGSVTTHFMLLRVDSSGAYDKVKIMDWTVPGPWGMQDGLTVNIITNADTGTLLTWEANPNAHSNIKRPATSGPASAMFRGRRRPGREPRAPQMSPRQGYGFGSGPVTYGMAVTTGTSVSLVSAPQVPGQDEYGDVPAVIPVLQAQDGSFVGEYVAGYDANYNYVYNMVSFDAAGNVRWIVPNEQPQIATDDGGVIGQSGIAYDSGGNATGQVGNTIGPTGPPGSGVASWSAQMYTMGTSGVSLDYFWFRYAESFGVLPGGSPSGNGTSVANVINAESMPLFQIPIYSSTTTSCSVGSTKNLLFPAMPAEKNPYLSSKSALISALKAMPYSSPPSPCIQFLFSKLPLNTLVSAITNQKAYDGLTSDLSLYAAGAYSAVDLDSEAWKSLATTAVCQYFRGQQTGGTIVEGLAQAFPARSTDAYFNSSVWAMRNLAPVDILHESLHNWLGLNDPDLYFWLTSKKYPLGQPTSVISRVLAQNKCGPQ
jgi:hypothetical protein